MSLDYFCVASIFFPDDGDSCIAFLVFIIILFGFALIVLSNEKYEYMMNWFERKFGDWF